MANAQSEVADATIPATQDEPKGAETQEAEPPKEASKKEKKKKSKKAKKDSSSKDTAAPEAASEGANPTPEDPDQADSGEDASATGKKAARFIVFVGNLPFAATTEQVTSHFSALHPISVRLLHDAHTGKSRGIAFVEFARYDHMKSALKTFHHTTFTCPSGKGGRPNKDGTPAVEERKINVELTAGGGGNTANRKDKIRAKNFKLNEERARRAAEEQKAKAAKLKKNGVKGGDGEAAQKEEAPRAQEEDSSIHPSRRSRVPGGR
ncbi:uncharacterized protein GGS25DRAFT_501872 [Hypoxylon fragiforme]|uniref:uncharacterized protein n=1 Tax=Hypoxylon fragiforme TaxID=63214 RepID=UPI0020C74607|nr:uncharacterized protein GGS25DRAFT_501872 [Hypoxylon fragiforme]KAI2604755.1 hypothetical protein GGS25DRAFT_501872 [Hypoxylon fragiforme]